MKIDIEVGLGCHCYLIRVISPLVVQFVAESRFANCEFANLFFDLDELQFS